MSRIQRLWLAALILGGVFLTAALVAPPGTAPANAQVATATPAPATPTPTKTTGEVIGIAPAADWTREIWDRFGWWALPLAALAIVVVAVATAPPAARATSSSRSTSSGSA
jgi:hypothetical protein